MHSVSSPHLTWRACGEAEVGRPGRRGLGAAGGRCSQSNARLGRCAVPRPAQTGDGPEQSVAMAGFGQAVASRRQRRAKRGLKQRRRWVVVVGVVVCELRLVEQGRFMAKGIHGKKECTYLMI